jgi:hypothetical protein
VVTLEEVEEVEEDDVQSNLAIRMFESIAAWGPEMEGFSCRFWPGNPGNPADFPTKREGDVPFVELDDGKIYRKALNLMVKTVVSCRFSLKPIQCTMDFTYEKNSTRGSNRQQKYEHSHEFTGFFGARN